MSTGFLAPLAGTIAPLSEVPDPVFAQGIVGKGFAISPSGDTQLEVVSPLDGKIAKVHPHAFVVAGEGATVLVHLGLDTVKLEGEGFKVHVENGDQVSAGQTLIEWDPAVAIAHEYSTACPVVFLDNSFPGEDTLTYGTTVTGGEELFTLDPTASEE